MSEDDLNKDLALIKYKRDNVYQKIECLYNKSLALAIDASPDDLTEFKVRCDRLDSQYESFESLQSDLVSCHIQLEKTDDLDTLKELNNSVDTYYFHIISVREKFFPTPDKNDLNDDSKPTGNAVASTSVKLPKINLPTFGGTLKEWPQFKDLFIALVHNNHSLSPVEKFHFLLSSTKDEPNTLVKSLPLCSNNYELVWTQLNERYDNKRLLAAQYLNEILNLSPVNVESPKLLRPLLDTLNENTSALKQMDLPDSLGDFIILNIALKNIDKHTRQLFERKFSNKEFPTLSDFTDFLKDHCKSLEAASEVRSNLKPVGPTKPVFKNNFKSLPVPTNSVPIKRSFHVSAQNQVKPTSCCLFCNEDHLVYHCQSYLKLTPIKRKEFIKSKEACFNCLSPSHMLNKCRSTRTCFKCKKTHHTSLHDDTPGKTTISKFSNFKTKIDQNPSLPSPSLPPTSTLTCTTTTGETQHKGSLTTTILLGTAVIHIQDSSGCFQPVRALVDPGSQSSFITESCVQKLRLPRRKHFQPILGLSETSVTSNNGLVSCLIKPLSQSSPTLTTTAIVLTRITSSLPSVPLHDEVKAYFQGWNLADPEFYLPGQIHFLIGADLFPQILYGGRYDTPQGLPTAFQTIFGWLLMGQTNLSPSSSPTISVHLAILNQESLESNLRKFWEIEEPPTSVCHLSPEDERCESIFTSTTKRNSAGRFVVDLPFKKNPPNLGESFDKAKGCLLSLEGKFRQNPELKTSYSNFLKEYEDLGHMTQAVGDEKQAYYIPHHGIFKNNNPSKLRVVFNASSQSSSGQSLNDELLVGPKLQTDICKILSLFRLHTYVFTTDIEKMYRQILINPEQRRFQAILWRDSPEKPISTFLLNTVTYGVSSSPFLALRTLRQLATEHSDQFPLASEVVLNCTFVDDILVSNESLEITQKIKSELIELFNLGGFPLRKWSSNSPELLKDVPSHHQELVFQEDKLENPTIKVLGLKWNPRSDVFSYDVHVEQTPVTKRSILSQVSRVYDPLGLVTPVILWAKCLIQKIWTLGLDWDQMLPSDLMKQTEKYFESLPLLSKLAIPRQTVLTGFIDIQIHGFSDASEVGYGCALYLRTVDKTGNISVCLLMAKSKVAPLKKISIPRLELCGAVLLSKTMKFCQEVLFSKFGQIASFAWSDSLVALHWIRSPPHQLKTFVANRVSELQSLIEPANWRHTPTTTNPADYASRGLLPTEILDNLLWWQGPSWLQEDETHWPNQPLPVIESEEFLAECRPSMSHVFLAADGPADEVSTFIGRFSNLSKLQNCLGWILRFINNCRKNKEKTISSFLTAKERTSSLHLLVKLTQQHHFQNHFKSISTKDTSPPFLRRLDPFFDENGIIRVGGRLENAQITYDAKHPMLLPKHSHLTHLIIDHFHTKYLHVGPRTLQSLLSQQFWVISARQVIRQRLSKCLICAKMKGTSIQPFMGNLPEARIRQTRPFLNVGVDFGGPFTTKSEKSRKPQMLKSYVCLFICFSTKAVHLELVSSLSTEAFLACLDRFVSRRGLCANIYSDQGTNFIGANRELQELYNLFQRPTTSTDIFSKLSTLGINWHFNPPAAPHFGGLWESGIRSTKYHLKRVLGNQVLTFEEFSTLLTKIEAILNSRPLCSLSPDPNEFQVLTPGHFLIGEPLVAIPQPDLTSVPLNRLSRWQLVQQTQRSFWKIWSNDYLHQLQQRWKWNVQQPNLKVNDLVLIKDKNLPPLNWTSARIVDTHPGEDGVVRVVTLKTPTGQLKRPVVQLCPLPQD